MLQKIGDKLHGAKWISYTVMGLLALVFAVWGAYGIVDLSMGAGQYAAKVNGEEIRADVVTRAWQQRQPQYLEAFGGEIPDDQRQALQSQLLDDFIRDAVVVGRSRELGYRVTAAQIREAYTREPAFQVEGRFDPTVARSRLSAAGLTVAAYEDDLRRSLQASQLAGAIGASDFLTPAEVARLFALQDEQRELRYALLLPEQFAGNAPVDDAAAQAWYEANAARFTVPDTVKLSYAELSLQEVAAQVQVTEAQVRQRYDESKDSYAEPETRQARHILITTGEGVDDAKAKALADDLSAQAKAGKDFAALALANSKDTASAQQGGDLGWATRDTYVPEFAAALFQMKPGDVSAPVKTQFGWHVIKLEGIRESRVRPFEDARAEIEATLRRDLAAEQFGSRQERLQERIDRGTGDFDALVKDFSLTTGEVPAFEKGRGGLPLGNDPALSEVVFGDLVLNQRRVGGPVPLGEERFVIVRVQDFKPQFVRPLAEVREAVNAGVLRDRGSEAARQAAAAALAKLEEGVSLDTVVASLKVKAEPARFVGRADPELPVQLREAAFGARKPSGGPVSRKVDLDDGGAALLQVTNVRLEPQAANPELRTLRSQAELRRTGSRDFEAYVSGLMKDAKIRRNLQVLQ